jgi:RimJ/RimL family protein N-acetyltransferase
MAFSPPETIEEPPIVLRRHREGDMQPLLQAVSSSSEHLKPWLAWASVEPLEPALQNFVSSSMERFDRGEDFGYAIWDSDELTLIGGAGLHPRLGTGRIEIGYWVRVGWLRRGVAFTAARALTSAAFELPEIEEVHIHCDEANVASAGIPRRLGFRLTRTVEDQVDAPSQVGRSMEWVIRMEEWRSLR